MQKHFAFVLPVLLAAAIPAAAQVEVRLHRPPEGQLAVEHLWWVDLNNPTRETFRGVWLHGEVREATRGVVFRANSNKFDLPPGRKRIRTGDIQVLNPWYARGYEVFLARTGKVPPGDYRYFVTLEPDLGGDTSRMIVREPTPPRLISPRDGDSLVQERPNFVWSRPGNWTGPVTYELKVVEVQPGQTYEQALRSNPTVLVETGIRTTTLKYPSRGRALDPFKSYAWVVTAVFDGSVQPLASEARGFTRAGPKLLVKPEQLMILGPKVTREIERQGNWFRVVLRIENLGPDTIHGAVVRDESRYLQCINDAEARKLAPPGGTTQPQMILWKPIASRVNSLNGGFSSEIRIGPFDDPLEPGRALQLRYSALPLLTFSLTGPQHTIGTKLRVSFARSDAPNARGEMHSYDFLAVNPVPGLADAWQAADYIINTCPVRLQGPDADVDTLLVTMARLAKVRTGALLYFTGSLGSAAVARNIYKAFGSLMKNQWQGGYLLIVGEEDVVPHWPDFTDWFKKDGVWTQSKTFTRSDYPYANLSGDRRPEIAVGRIIGRNAGELRTPVEVSLSVRAHGAENNGSHVMMISGHEKISDAFPVVAESGAAYLRREKSTSVACWHGEYYATKARTMHKAIIHADWTGVLWLPTGADKCCKYCSPRPCGCGCDCLNKYTPEQLATWVLQEEMGQAAFDAQYPPGSGDYNIKDTRGRIRRVPGSFGPAQVSLAANEAAQIEFERGGYFGASYLFLPTNSAAHDLFVSRIKNNLSGRDLIVYNGHSGPEGWYGVDAGTVSGANIMSSSTRPVAACFGCSGGDYPGASNSIARVFLRQGAGAYIGATQMINTADANRQVRDKGFLKHWARGKRIGDILRDWKYDMAVHTILTSGLDLRLLYVMNLYGDPKFGGD